jgi:uncharacterized circularly permuted ATP-grasp superfamily protein/uncharacterized alpha-E superfamily protein
MGRNGRSGFGRWHEVLDERGRPRPAYQPLLRRLERFSPAHLRDLEERLDATLRELGVTFQIPGEDHQNTWFCDLLPQLFSTEEWATICAGFRQRIRAFELFLRDVYGKREILRQGVVPIAAVLGSPHFQRAAAGLRPSGGDYLHLSGMCLTRDQSGQLLVKHHYFSQASGIAYMVQNRRLLARVLPELFEEGPIESIADIPTEILMRLREVTPLQDPAVVLLSPGPTSAVYSEHSFLARRMGIPVVQGGDLVVLDDRLYLKTVSGLERIDVVYRRVADPWLDPLVFRRDSRFGVPGLIQCVRRGTLAVVNGVGAQVADDRSLLHFANTIIRFYLAEAPILPTLQTYWLGDLDQLEMVLERPERFQIRSLTGERYRIPEERTLLEIREEIRRGPNLFVAQPIEDTVKTICICEGKQTERLQDHIVFGAGSGEEFEVLPGALTRISSAKTERTESEFGGGGKDTWVFASTPTAPEGAFAFRRPWILPARRVTSRVAEAFYWQGRYLERAMNVARMIQVIETLEMEELNSAERKLYRPVWNQLLPPVESTRKRGRRSLTTTADRYRLMLDSSELGSVATMIGMALRNADSLREVISPEAWASLESLRSQFRRLRFREDAPEPDTRRATRRLADAVVALVPQFFATAQLSMLADDGWRFCELGQLVERAGMTANASCTMASTVSERIDTTHAIEIELSAFLRLLGTRDAYRRIYQTRAAPAPVLEFLWQNAEMPRSVMSCLAKCKEILQNTLPKNSRRAQTAEQYLENLLHKVRRVDWYGFFVESGETKLRVLRKKELVGIARELLSEIRQIHHIISDYFLSHQGVISERQPTLF